MLCLHTHVHTCTVLHTRAVHIHAGHTQRAQTPLVHACASRAHTYTAHRRTLHAQLHGTALHTHIARCTLPRHPHAHRGLHAHTEHCTRSMHACIASHALTRGALHTHGIARSQRCTLTALHTHPALPPRRRTPLHGIARSLTALPALPHPCTHPPLHTRLRCTPRPAAPPSAALPAPPQTFPRRSGAPSGAGGEPMLLPRKPPALTCEQAAADPR